MASTYFSRDFTATDGDRWELDQSGPWRRASGYPAFDALIFGNRGQAGNTAAERMYLAAAVSPSDSVQLQVDARWKNAAGAGRWFGSILRASYGGQTCYSIELDSNVGSTQGRVRRRVGSTWTTLLDWASVNLTSATLNTGLTLTARVTTQDGGKVLLELLNGSTVLLSHTDSDHARLESGRYAGILIGPNSVTDDITWDAFAAEDLTDENTTPPSGESDEVTLVVDGQLLREADWTAQNITVGRMRQSYDQANTFTLADFSPWHTPALFPGQWVEVRIGADTVAAGRLVTSESNIKPGEGHKFTLDAPAKLAQDVAVRHPVTRARTVVFNVEDPADTDYDPTLEGLTLGQCIQWIFDNHSDGPQGLRARRAIPSSGTAYEASDLAQLTTVVPKLSVTGDVLRAVESLLAYTHMAKTVDPATRKWRFRRRATAPKVNLELQDGWMVGQLKVDTGKNRTAVRIRGTRQQFTQQIIKNTGGSPDLLPGWRSELESSYTSTKQWKNRADGTVDTIGVDGGQLTLDPIADDPTLVEWEWDGARLIFNSGPEAGNLYLVDHNTASQIRLVETAWKSGGPSNGDTFSLVGDGKNGARDNGFSEVGRRWKLSNDDLRIPKDWCGTVKLSAGDVSVDTEAWVQDDPEGGQAIVTDLPAIGLVNFPSKQQNDPCSETSPLPPPAAVEASVPTFEVTSPFVPELRVPENEGEFRGTAWATDPAKWDGAGVLERGDPGVEREYPLPIDSFDGSPEQVTAYTELADMILEVLGTLSRALTITIQGKLDTSFLGLNWRLTISDSGEATGEETAEDFLALAAEWDPETHTTTLYAGSVANGRFNIASMRRVFESRNNLDALNKRREQVEQLLACNANNQRQAGNQAQLPPVQICADTVSLPSGTTTPGKTVSKKIEHHTKVIEKLSEIVGVNKGFDVVSPDENGNPRIQRDDGIYFGLDLDTGIWTDLGNLLDPSDPDYIPPGGDLPAGETPFDDPDDLGGHEGMFWAWLQLLASNAGKALWQDENGVWQIGPAPGSPTPNTGTITWWGTDSFGNPIPLSLPQGPGGGVVPGTGTMQDFALKDMLGVELQSMDDPIGWVFSAPGGAVIRGTNTPAEGA